MPPLNRRENSGPDDAGWSNREVAGSLLQTDAASEATESRAESIINVELGAATFSPDGKENEDRLKYLPDGSAVLADGVGSKDYSAPAAELVTDELIKALSALDGLSPDEIEQVMGGKLSEVHDSILSEQSLRGHSMAAAMSLIKPVEHAGKNYVFIANVGDAPVYRLRDGHLQEITGYHEALPPRDERPALGKPSRPIPKTYVKRAKDGDTFILSSNGLRKNDPDMELMEKLLNQASGPQEAAEQLVSQLPELRRDSRTAFVMNIGKH